MKNTERRYPPRNTAVQRPISNSTDFDDTEFEVTDSEEGVSPRMSMDSVCLIIFSTLGFYC